MKPAYGAAAFVCLLAVNLSACSTPQLAKLPVCDGKDRRPANPYGVTLPGMPDTPAPAHDDPSAALQRSIYVFDGAGEQEAEAPGPSGETVPPLREPELSARSSATYRRC